MMNTMLNITSIAFILFVKVFAIIMKTVSQEVFKMTRKY
jgi:hypothetical protein